MNLLLRADASPEMGSGHVMRCLAIAEVLIERGHRCTLAANTLPPALAARLAEAGIALSRLTGDADATATMAVLRKIGAAAAIVDGYHFSDDWRMALASTGVPVLALSDDTKRIPAGAGLVLNAAAAENPDADGIRFLYGTRYVLLRREITLAARLPPLPIEARRSVLITFGGTDPAGLTLPVATALAEALETTVAIDVAIGGGVPDAEAIAVSVRQIANHIRSYINVTGMGELMHHAGLAISAAGNTTGELAALGVPSILVVVADNQLAGAKAAAGHGWCRIVDAREPDVVDRIVALATAAWSDPVRRAAEARRAREAVVTDGADRAVDALLDLVNRWRLRADG